MVWCRLWWGTVADGRAQAGGSDMALTWNQITHAHAHMHTHTLKDGMKDWATVCLPSFQMWGINKICFSNVLLFVPTPHILYFFLLYLVSPGHHQTVLFPKSHGLHSSWIINQPGMRRAGCWVTWEKPNGVTGELAEWEASQGHWGSLLSWASHIRIHLSYQHHCHHWTHFILT